MSELERLFDELDVHMRSFKGPKPTDPKLMAQDILAVRVKSAKLLGAMTTAASSDARVSSDGTFASELSDRLFTARQALGRLQAKWRVIECMDDLASYRAEARPVTENINDLVLWGRNELRTR